MKNNTIKIKAFLCLLLLTCGWVSVQAQQVQIGRASCRERVCVPV